MTDRMPAAPRQLHPLFVAETTGVDSGQSH
jgi:hypothetical protein